MKKKQMFVVCLSLAVLIAGCFWVRDIAERNRKTLFRYPDEFWQVYTELSEDKTDSAGREWDSFQENGKDYVNYFIMANKALDLIYQSEFYGKEGKISEAEEILKNLMATYEAYGKYPRPEYKSFEYGWVSSMDAPVIMLASEMMYEHTGEKQYRDFSLGLLPYALEKTYWGGV